MSDKELQQKVKDLRSEIFLKCIQIRNKSKIKKIQDELNERKKNAVFGSELLSKDGGKNKMGMTAKKDDDFLSPLVKVCLFQPNVVAQQMFLNSSA